jgi:hypothetical protein
MIRQLWVDHCSCCSNLLHIVTSVGLAWVQ